MNNPKLITTSLVLAISALLVACGGGETASTVTSSAKQSATVEALAPAPSASASTVADTTEGSSVHSSDAFVLKADTVGKAANESLSSRRVSRDSQRRPSQAQTISLGAAPEESITKREQYNAKSSAGTDGTRAKLYQTGFGRPVAATSQSASLHQLMAWTTLSNGNAFGTVRFESTGAVGIRLGLLVKSMPDGAMVRVSAADSSTALEFSGTMINQAIASNVAADGDTSDARTYWLPMTLGSSADLAIELPIGVNSDQLSIALPTLVHMVETAQQANLEALARKTDCSNRTPDAMCSTPLPPAANAVAAMDFVIPGRSGTFVCTGTLLADKAGTQQPYFLTAQHCISTQTSASTLATYWFWRSTGCDTGVLRSDYITQNFVRAGGADLLFTRPELTTNPKNPVGTDTSFLKLREAPPAGAMFAGWSTGRQAVNPTVNLIGLHHPKGLAADGGDLLRQSTGTVSGMARVSGYYNGNPDLPLVDQTNDTRRPMYGVTWGTGITEGGSSGSALFLNGTSSNPQVVGQLWGGASGCTAPQSNPDFYGRFDLAYQDGLITWLNPGYKMVFRFYNVNNGAHFYSANVAERDNVRNTISNLWHEGPVFSVAPAAASGLSPVYRFYNTYTGVHFYTINESERNALAAYPSFQLEGVAWYARKSADTNTVPVYRFYKRSLGTHLYTVSVAERDNLIANAASTYDYEGVAYHAWAPN